MMEEKKEDRGNKLVPVPVKFVRKISNQRGLVEGDRYEVLLGLRASYMLKLFIALYSRPPSTLWQMFISATTWCAK